ncbi:MAG TPA: beta-galactosidase, partial [Anaerolineae bacterium]|nr:beta-galactosidase [Anaerolineae bacterium]
MPQRTIRFNFVARAVLILVWLLAVQWPGGPLVTVGPPQSVVTNNPKVGIHTRLTDEAAPWKVQHTLQMVREMGAPWIVEFFPWAYLEPSQGTFAWEHADEVVDQAQAQGLTVIARLGLVPVWARPDPQVRETTFTYLDAEHYKAFGDFVS